MTDRLGLRGRRVLVALTLLAAFLAISATASAQTYTPTPPPNVLELSTNTPAPGGSFNARGCGFQPGSTVSATIAGSPAGTIVVGADGCAVGTLTAPSDPGTYTVCFTGLVPGGGTQQLCNTITVSAAQGAVTTGQVPFTGTRNLILVGVGGLLLLFFGVILVVTTMRRRMIDS